MFLSPLGPKHVGELTLSIVVDQGSGLSTRRRNSALHDANCTGLQDSSSAVSDSAQALYFGPWLPSTFCYLRVREQNTKPEAWGQRGDRTGWIVLARIAHSEDRAR